MIYVPDTNVLLRFAHRPDLQHAVVASAIRKLKSSGDEIYILPQNCVEFWNVFTRPTSRNGFGFSVADALVVLSNMESEHSLLLDTHETLRHWRRLIEVYEVKGVQVHDARMTAALFGPLHGQATVLHIVSQMPLMFNRDQRNPDYLAELVMSENTLVNRNIAAVQTLLSEAGVDAKIRIRVGMVVEQIKEELLVGGYDLLVIGAHHARTPLDRVLLEDLSTELLLDSPIPVLVVRNVG